MHYCDTWKRHIPREKLAAYKKLREDGVIKNAHATYARRPKITVVEYDSNLSRQDLIEMMRRISESEVKTWL